MAIVFADAEEKFVKTNLLYGHTDNYLYEDEAHTTKIDKDKLLNYLIKGVTVFYNNAYYTPTSFKENAGVIEVTIATVINAASSASVTLYSEEHAED